MTMRYYPFCCLACRWCCLVCFSAWIGFCTRFLGQIILFFSPDIRALGLPGILEWTAFKGLALHALNLSTVMDSRSHSGSLCRTHGSPEYIRGKLHHPATSLGIEAILRALHHWTKFVTGLAEQWTGPHQRPFTEENAFKWSVPLSF